MLHPGLYEQVISNALTGELAEIPWVRKSVAPIDKAEASKVLAQYLADVVQKGLDNVLDNGGDPGRHRQHQKRRVRELHDRRQTCCLSRKKASVLTAFQML